MLEGVPAAVVVVEMVVVVEVVEVVVLVREKEGKKNVAFHKIIKNFIA